MIELVLAIVIGVLYGTGVYMLLRRNLVKFILALGLISNATHLLIFTGAGLVRGAPPLIPLGQETLSAPYGDPLPQALILTAIVISFGLTAFAILLVHRTHIATGSDDPEDLVTTDAPPPYKPYPLPTPNLPSLIEREKDTHDTAEAKTEREDKTPKETDPGPTREVGA